MNAVINGGRVECGKCGALLAYYRPLPGKVVLNGDLFEYDSSQKEEPKTLEIKCKHKDKQSNWKECNTINEIIL